MQIDGWIVRLREMWIVWWLQATVPMNSHAIVVLQLVCFTSRNDDAVQKYANELVRPSEGAFLLLLPTTTADRFNKFTIMVIFIHEYTFIRRGNRRVSQR